MKRVKVVGDLFHGKVPPGAVYVGRQAPGLTCSLYANPYPVRVHGVFESIRLYREYLDQHPEIVTRARTELAGKDLACWCKPDDPCHADVLIEAISAHP